MEYAKTVISKKYANYRFVKMDIGDKNGLGKLFAEARFEAVCNLAAQAECVIL